LPAALIAMHNAAIAYKGYTLKSKTEFYWARHFEVQEIAWEYEPTRFKADGGVSGKLSYTPDFGLNNRTLFIEIKIWGATNVDNNFCLCIPPLLIIFGTPDRHYVRLKPAGAIQLDRGHFRNWNLAYQRVAA
jgi:hypothetical protein